MGTTQGSITARSVDEVTLIPDTTSHYAPVLITPLSIRIRRADVQKIWSSRQGRGKFLPTPTVPAVRNNGNARCLMWSRLHSTIHHLAARRTESAHVPLKAGDYLFWVRDERVAKPEHVKHASFALLFRSLLPCQRWPLPEKD
jgi:hypothetical protein